MELFNSQKEHSPASGIKCDVKNCVYHCNKEGCSAHKITVGPTFAVSSADTICATFKSR